MPTEQFPEEDRTAMIAALRKALQWARDPRTRACALAQSLRAGIEDVAAKLAADPAFTAEERATIVALIAEWPSSVQADEAAS